MSRYPDGPSVHHVLLNHQPDLNPHILSCPKCGRTDEPRVEWVNNTHALVTATAKNEWRNYWREHLDVICRTCGYDAAILPLDGLS